MIHIRKAILVEIRFEIIKLDIVHKRFSSFFYKGKAGMMKKNLEANNLPQNYAVLP